MKVTAVDERETIVGETTYQQLVRPSVGTLCYHYPKQHHYDRVVCTD
jgi:hypothetical protein